ncbi:hypothetical protein HPB50_027915 [Hyalomma asiaticum]|nr:hypothetical protein HPB50_027915 [Hyalomma asiaticum]
MHFADYILLDFQELCDFVSHGHSPIDWQVYIDAAARNATPEHKKALLLNALGVEGLNCYLRAVDEEQQPGADRETLEDAGNLQPTPGSGYIRQRPVETAVDFIQEVQRQVKPTVKLCEFGAAGELLAFDQIAAGISSPQLQDGAPRLGRLGIVMAMANMAAFLPEFRGKMAPASPARPAPSPAAGPAASSPATSWARASACFRCGSSQHWANSGACPSRSRTCTLCGKRGHFGPNCVYIAGRPLRRAGPLFLPVPASLTVAQIQQFRIKMTQEICEMVNEKKIKPELEMKDRLLNNIAQFTAEVQKLPALRIKMTQEICEMVNEKKIKAELEMKDRLLNNIAQFTAEVQKLPALRIKMTQEICEMVNEKKIKAEQEMKDRLLNNIAQFTAEVQKLPALRIKMTQDICEMVNEKVTYLTGICSNVEI